MPILPENKALYPPNWQEIRARILKRAGNKCEGCGVVNYSEVGRGRSKIITIVLTVAHLDHDPTRNDDSNLRAYCQQCHNRHDSKHRASTRLARQVDDRQLNLGEVE